MRISLALLLLAAVALATAVDSSSTVFPTLPGLGRQEPIAPRTYAHSFAHTDWRGRSTKLEYKTEVSEHVYHLHEMAPQFQITACNDNDVVFSISGDVSAASGNMPAVGKLLSGDLSAGCKNSTSGKGMVLQRRITGVSVDGNQVTFATVPAQINEMLKYAKVHFKSNAFEASQKTEGERRDFLTWLGDAAKTAFDAVVDSVGGIGKAAEDLVTGNFQANNVNLLGSNGQFGYNYDAGSGRASQVYDIANLAGDGASLSVTCSNCYASLAAELDFTLDISDYTINTFSLVADTNAEINVEVTVTAQYAGQWQNTAQLADITGPTVTVDIGVPLVLHFTFPLQGGYSANLDAQASASAVFTAKGSLSYGVSYTATDGWNPVKSHYFNFGSKIEDVTGTVNGHANAFLMPGVTISAYGVIAVGMGLTPYLTSTLTGNINGVAGNSAYDVEATADYGLNVQFNADVDFPDVVEKKWTSPTYNIFNYPVKGSPYYFVPSDTFRSVDKKNIDLRQEGISIVPAAESFGIRALETIGTCNARTSCNDAHGMLDCASQTCICSDGWTGAACTVPPAPIIIAANTTRTSTTKQQLMSVSPDRSAVKAAGFCPSGSCAVLRAEDVKTCSHLAGQPVCMPLSSQTVAEVDAAVGAELEGVSKVGPRCIASMRHQLCSLRFPLCTPSTARMNPMCFSDCVASYQACDLSSNDATALCVAASGARNGSSVAPSPQHMSNEDQELCAGSRSGFAAGSNRTCVIASELKTCTHLNGRPIALTPLAFATPALADAHVASLMQGTFASESCRSAALAYRCSQFMPVCGGKKMNDPHFPVLLSRDTCLSILSGCELPSIVNRACNSSTALWVNDTVAPAFMASSYTVRASELPGSFSDVDDSPDNVANATSFSGWKVPLIIASAAFGLVAVAVVAAIVAVRSRRFDRSPLASTAARDDVELQVRTEE